MTEPRLRQAVRGLLLDEDDQVLLVHFHWEGLDLADGFWACPGGGIDPGESPEAALRRELAEELGLESLDIKGPVWRLTRLFPMSQWDGQTDADVAAGVVTFSPRDLSEQLTRVLDEGVPRHPREIAALG